MKHINQARAKEDGIVFYSNATHLIGYYTFRDSNDEIRWTTVLTNEDELEEINKDRGKQVNKRTIIALDAILVGIGVILRNISVIMGALYFSIFISRYFFYEIKIIYMIKFRKGRFQSIARYHAAEHMVIKAYEKLQRIPTIQEARTFSRFSKRCDSNKIIFKTIYYTVLSICVVLIGFFNGSICILITSISIILILIADLKKWLRFFQVLFTNVPSDDELEVAIEGLKNFERMEEEIRNPDNPFGVIGMLMDLTAER